jgi:uncharacterized protein (TIGR02996 family)
MDDTRPACSRQPTELGCTTRASGTEGCSVTTADALTAAILATPDDDLPRLVYADWCEENNQADRAEFIRIQCNLARADHLNLDQRLALTIREKVLLGSHSQRWLEPLRQKGEPLLSARTHGQFRRGFVEVVWMPAAWFNKKADKLFARCPVRELRVTLTSETDFNWLMVSDAVTRLESLDLSDRRLGNHAPLNFRLYADRWQPGKLKRLRLRACQIDDLGAEMLEQIPVEVFDPDELDLSLNPISEKAMQRLRRRFGDTLRFE